MLGDIIMCTVDLVNTDVLALMFILRFFKVDQVLSLSLQNKKNENEKKGSKRLLKEIQFPM